MTTCVPKSQIYFLRYYKMTTMDAIDWESTGKDTKIQSKSWVFRLCNYTDKDEQFFKDLTKNYLCYGREVCPTTGTPHLQGCITFSRAYRFSQLKKLHPKAYWSNTKVADAENYCMKDGDYIIQDNRTPKGTRTDLKKAIDVATKDGLKALAHTNPEVFIKYHKGISELLTIIQPERNFKPKVYWLYGSTGVGKTKIISTIFGLSQKDVWFSGDNGKYWDGYENQDTVVLDDFRPDFCAFQTLLKVLDRYPFSVNIKFGTRILNSHFMVITAPTRPTELFENSTSEDIKQLTRRIDHIFELKKGKGVNLHIHTTLLRDKLIFELERNETYKGCFVRPFEKIKPLKPVFTETYKVRNILISTFREEFLKLRLLSSGLF